MQTYSKISYYNLLCFHSILGTNACYAERLEAVKKFKGDRAGHTHVIINTEWGAFGDFNVDEHGKPVDKGILKDFLTCADKELNTEVENPGQQMYASILLYVFLGRGFAVNPSLSPSPSLCQI